MDTLGITRDSVATCVKKTVEICQPCINEAGATWQDVAIRGLEYVFMLFIAYWLISGIFRIGMQLLMYWLKKKQDENERKWKQMADLKSRLLDLQKDYAEKKRDKDGTALEKYSEEGYKQYANTLKSFIDDKYFTSNNDKTQGNG